MRSRRVLAAVIVVVAAGGVAVALGRGSGGSRPAEVADRYYGLLRDHHADQSFTLLCSSRRAGLGAAGYEASYAEDVRTGTGVASWKPVLNRVQTAGAAAEVPGTLALVDGDRVDLTVYLTREAGQWRVCGSDLGGVLPNAGTPAGVTT